MTTATETRFVRRPNGGADSPPPPGKRTLTARRIVIAGICIVAALALAKWTQTWWLHGRFIETTDDAYIGGEVTVIAPKISGFIATLSVTDNQHVRAGELLVKLDDRDYSAALAKADAAVAIQEAALTNLDATHAMQESFVDSARASIASATAETTRASNDVVRFRELLGDNAVSVQDSQRAEAIFQQASANGDKARAELAAALRQLLVVDSQKRVTRATLAQAQAERELARLNVNYTELRAPIDGVVGNRSARSGAFATAGSHLISLVPERGLWVDANFKESQLRSIKPGSPATVEIDSIPDRIFKGRVTSVAPATGAQFSVLPPENATGNFTKIVQRVAVRIALDDEAGAMGDLRPGLSVVAHVNTKDGPSQRAGL